MLPEGRQAELFTGWGRQCLESHSCLFCLICSLMQMLCILYCTKHTCKHVGFTRSQLLLLAAGYGIWRLAL